MKRKLKIDMVLRVAARFILPALVLLFSSCATGKRHVNTINETSIESSSKEQPVYTLYAIGDAGHINEQSGKVMSALAQITSKEATPGMILFLGDNIYPAGLAASEDQEARELGERILKNQIDALASYKGEIIYIPGNHDWNEFRPGGLDAIKREGDFIRDLRLPNLKLLPEDGCGGPYVKELNQKTVLLILDSQWWIQDWSREPKMNEGCAVKTREELIHKVESLLDQYRNRQVLIAMHHPLESRGPHGGYYTLRDHLFPLTKVVKWLYLPLPVIGSIYPWSRGIIGHPQDLRGKAYHEMKEDLLKIATGHKLIFLSGHEHTLQYLSHEGQDFIISGSGSNQNGVANGRDLLYGHKAGGFMRLEFYGNGIIMLSAFEVNGSDGQVEIAFRTKIREGDGF